MVVGPQEKNFGLRQTSSLETTFNRKMWDRKIRDQLSAHIFLPTSFCLICSYFSVPHTLAASRIS